MTTATGAAISVLAQWEPPSKRQAALRDEFVNYLGSAHLTANANASDPLHRDCTPAHLTASALIVAPTSGRVLLTLHAVVGRWLQTGGHIESADATISAAALREAREESGLGDLALISQPLLLDRHDVSCRDSAGQRRTVAHLDVQWCAIATGSTAASISAESLDLRWWDMDAIPTADASVVALVAAARRALSVGTAEFMG